MSEFSESYHLRSERLEDAIELLRRAKRKGYVYQPVNGWITFTVEAGQFEPDMRVVAAANQPLLHYVCAEDHGWNFTLFDQANAVSAYRCDWDNEITIDDSKYERDVLLPFVPAGQLAVFDDFESRLQPQDFDELFEAEPAKLFAQAIGLEHYDWTSYRGMDNAFHDSTSDNSDMTEVA